MKLFNSSFIQLVILLILLQNQFYSQTNEILYDNKEIVLQVYNNDNGNATIEFTVQPVGEAYKFDSQNCDYYVETMNPIFYSVTGNQLGDDFYCVIDNPDNITRPANKKFIWGLLEIKVVDITYETITNYFYYDVRDCQYYTPCYNQSADITIRYDAENDNIWYIGKGNPGPEEPSTESDWEIVNVDTVNAWDRMGLTHCPLTPATPTGFTLSGSVGSNPILTWNANTEQMLDGYNIYISVNGGPYSFHVTLDENATSYTDNGYIISNNKFAEYRCYAIKAFGMASNESPMSIPRCTRAVAINKEAVEGVEKNESVINNLYAAYPNPFNPTTVIKYNIEENGFVSLKVYDILGREVAALVNEYKNAGSYSVTFNASDLPSGNYIYSIKTNDYFDSKVLNVIK